MLANYLKIALRNLVKHPAHAALNIGGFSIGIAAFILIVFYVTDELSYDRYHSRADRIFRVATSLDLNGVGEKASSCAFPLAPTLQKEHPDKIEAVCRFFNFQAKQHLMTYGKEKHYEKNFFLADSSITDIFDLNIIKGDSLHPLDTAGSMMISERMALKYFGSTDPVGKTMAFGSGLPLTVTAVFSDIPAQSHFRYDFLASMSTLRKIYKPSMLRGWIWNPCWTYVLLKEGVSREAVDQVLPGFMREHIQAGKVSISNAWLQPLTDIHLKSNLDYEIQENGNIKYVYILIIIAIFIIVIACINFMNLSTARSANRAREIGMRKTLGALRIQLIAQFVTEAALVVACSILLALAWVELSLPLFNEFTGKNLDPGILFQWELIWILPASLLTLSLLAGLYPAFYMSSFRPIAVLRGVFKPGLKSGYLRQSLVVLQFALASILIVCTIVLICQVRYTEKKDLGFNQEQLILINIENTKMTVRFDEMKAQLLKSPYIKAVTGSEDIPGAFHNTHEFRPHGYLEDQWYYFPTLVVREDFVKVMQMEIVAGRDYCSDSVNDRSKAILVNEAMVRYMGYTSNEEALGKKFSSYNGEEKITGVVRDFHTNSLYSAIQPFVLNLKESPEERAFYTRYMIVRVEEGREQEALAFIEQCWNTYRLPHPFTWSYLSDELNKLYVNDHKLSRLAVVSSLLAICIACLGLLGLVSYSIESRSKETAMRKLLGGSVWTLTWLQFRSFMVLVAVSAFFSIPGALWISLNWLSHFAFRTTFPWWSFFVAVGITLMSAFLTVLIPAIRASGINIAGNIKHNG